ncbi:hypothetical protein GW17_00020157 [Ensete ventricosum]|nr:hypothetical protein GW17_00020157 [Ensete ventricosum]
MRIGVRIARFASSLFRSPHFPLLSSTRRLRCNLSPSAASPEVRSRYLLPPSSHLLAFFPCWSLPSFWIARAGKAPYRIVRTGPPADQYTIARYRVVPPKSTALAVDFGRKKKREKKKREKLVPRALLFSDSPARSVDSSPRAGFFGAKMNLRWFEKVQFTRKLSTCKLTLRRNTQCFDQFVSRNLVLEQFPYVFGDVHLMDFMHAYALGMFAISTFTVGYGRYIPVRQVAGTRTARYRAVVCVVHTVWYRYQDELGTLVRIGSPYRSIPAYRDLAGMAGNMNGLLQLPHGHGTRPRVYLWYGTGCKELWLVTSQEGLLSTATTHVPSVYPCFHAWLLLLPMCLLLLGCQPPAVVHVPAVHCCVRACHCSCTCHLLPAHLLFLIHFLSSCSSSSPPPISSFFLLPLQNVPMYYVSVFCQKWTGSVLVQPWTKTSLVIADRDYAVGEQVYNFNLYRPYRAVYTGPAGYGYTDHLLPGGTTKIDRRRLIEGEIDRRWSIKREKGKRKRRKKKKEVPPFPVLSLPARRCRPRPRVGRAPPSPVGDFSPT